MVVEPLEFSLVVGINYAREVWNTLEQRFASTLRANILNMKIGLQNIEKFTDTINGFLQRIKAARDWLLAVGVMVDNEEWICTCLRSMLTFFCNQDLKLIIHMKKLWLKMPKEMCILWQCMPHQTRSRMWIIHRHRCVWIREEIKVEQEIHITVVEEEGS